jgi:hypothetical protein
MAEMNSSVNKGTNCKENAVFDLPFFLRQLKETVISALGIGWISEDRATKVSNVAAGVVLVYVRWWIKLAVFIGAIFLVLALLGK